MSIHVDWMAFRWFGTMYIHVQNCHIVKSEGQSHGQYVSWFFRPMAACAPPNRPRPQVASCFYLIRISILLFISPSYFVFSLFLFFPPGLVVDDVNNMRASALEVTMSTRLPRGHTLGTRSTCGQMILFPIIIVITNTVPWMMFLISMCLIVENILYQRKPPIPTLR